MPVKPIPDGYHSVTPYLIIKGAAKALDFYKKALAAEELMRMPAPDGSIAHAEIKVGNSPIMIADENPTWGNRSPQSLNGSPVIIHLYVNDVDKVAASAIAAGAKVLMPVTDQFYGDRSGRFQDPFGHLWVISTHKEDLTPDEIGRRAEKAMKQ